MRVGFHSLRSGRSLKAVLVTVASFGVIFAIPVHVYSQSLVLHRFVAKKPDSKIEQLLYLSAGVELMRLGMSSTRDGSDENYVLRTDYAATRGTLKIDYTLVRPGAHARTLAAEQATLPIDQNLGEEIAAAIRALVQKADLPVVPSTKAEIEGLLPQASVSAAPVATSPPGLPSRPAGAALSGAALSGTAVQPEPAPASARAKPAAIAIGPPRKTLLLKFDSSVSAAGVLFFGRMTEYFHYGLAGLMTAGVAFPLASSTFGVGLDLSFIRALNDYGVIGGPLYLSTAGVNLRYGTGSRSAFRLAGDLSAGPALVTVAAPGRTLVQTAPYGAVGVRAVVALGKHLSLGGEVRFLAIYANGLIIMGAVPAVTLHVGP